jgi:D-3-phosphoglycerate dehydrogenase
MGQAFTKRLKSFDCQILAYDKYKSGFANQFVMESSLEDIFEKANILSLHLPLTQETRKMVDFDFFSKFRKSIVIINTSRGEILSLKALKYYLEKNKIIGAALDVLENEDIKNLEEEEREMFNYLTESDKIIFTPHIAGWSFESYEQISKVLAEKIIREFI